MNGFTSDRKIARVVGITFFLVLAIIIGKRGFDHFFPYTIKEDVVIDKNNGLMWMSGSGEKITWEKASEFCSRVGGFFDWRVPTVDELKTLIVGCESGSEACAVGGSCLGASCWSSSCHCERERGHGEHGYYQRPGYWQGEGHRFWSASRHTDTKNTAWYVDLSTGLINDIDISYPLGVRCVRTLE